MKCIDLGFEVLAAVTICPMTEIVVSNGPTDSTSVALHLKKEKNHFPKRYFLSGTLHCGLTPNISNHRQEPFGLCDVTQLAD
jgi:hypothetical protein